MPETKPNLDDLYWLAALLTGSREIAAEVTIESVSVAPDRRDCLPSWTPRSGSRQGEEWSRRLVIANALAAVREELKNSARRIALRRDADADLPDRSWALDRASTKSDLEQALLRMDAFPRAAVLLQVFEGASLRDVAHLLESDPELVEKALAIGLSDLTANLARMQGWIPAVNLVVREEQYA
jgi:DNA-directed RNA polymerase specialized sigma24 family protein